VFFTYLSWILSLLSVDSIAVSVCVSFAVALAACGVMLCVVFCFLCLFCVLCGDFDFDSLLGFAHPIFVD
jgi:hypothetical protein